MASARARPTSTSKFDEELTMKTPERGDGNRPGARAREAQPLVGQRGAEMQPYGSLVRYPLGLGEDVRRESVEALNLMLADTCVLRDLYKKHHWQVSGATFYQLHLLYDKHYEEQSKLVDLLAERVQTLGGVAVAMAHDIADTTRLERPPRGREEVPVQLSRLLEAHERVLIEARAAAKRAGESGDDGTNDLLVSDVIRTNEMQVWFVSEHLVETPLVRANETH
jgi:starvation-inducible DNA-binding protein